MGAALHLAHIHETPVRKKRRKGGGGDGEDDGPFILIPRDACEACARHWHHKCWGANILDEQRPNCPCPCDDPADPTGERMRRAAWSDLAQHDPIELGLAVQRLQLREAGATFVCSWKSDESGLRSTR